MGDPDTTRTGGAEGAGDVLPPYALVLSDIDGTLLDPGHRLTDATRAAVRRVVGAGARFGLATGRMPSGTTGIVEELGVPCARICYSGAFVLDEHGDVVSSTTIDVETAGAVLRVLREGWPELEPCFFAGWHWYVEHPDHPAVARETAIVRARPEQARLDELLARGVAPNKIFCSRSAGIVSSSVRIAQELRAAFPQLTVIRSSNGMMVEVVGARVSKATGARALLERTDIPASGCLAFGDDENDVELLRMAGRGVAMANAAADVRRAADDVTASNADDGVARYLLAHALP